MQETKLFQLANSLIDVLVYAPSLEKAYSNTDWGPRHAVVSLEHLLGLVAGGQSERLDKLHSRMAQMNFTPAPRRALSETQRDDILDITRPASDADEIPDADTPDEGFHSQSEFHWREQTASDGVSVSTDQDIDLPLDLTFMARSIPQEQEKGLHGGEGGVSLDYMTDLGPQPLLFPQPAFPTSHPGESHQFSYDFESRVS